MGVRKVPEADCSAKPCAFIDGGHRAEVGGDLACRNVCVKGTNGEGSWAHPSVGQVKLRGH